MTMRRSPGSGGEMLALSGGALTSSLIGSRGTLRRSASLHARSWGDVSRDAEQILDHGAGPCALIQSPSLV